MKNTTDWRVDAESRMEARRSSGGAEEEGVEEEGEERGLGAALVG